ncbi:lysine N(6)-hydroxylase/L-ornithine N(5)-oxygenase family protein [Pseudomonas tussilaginis]|uniref:lysine N(6)-hydroxylase/L-ornithine N(5)-oxygenase family protein n=1 Tax=Pseudomonas sp. 5 TaxID=1619949 RepID=UPI0012E001B1|nr:SidA/IucD/PvdA family monooxygenase [Pseudomonas sp. 5]
MSASMHYDIIGVGFGPSNISLAITLEEEAPGARCLFLEKEASSEWQTGLLLANSDIQNHPLRDLATPRNPRSYYSFTNYLHEKGRLFEHLNMGLYYPYRYEYRDYIKWAAEHFNGSVHYSTVVSGVRALAQSDSDARFEIKTTAGKTYTCTNLVVGTGRTPYVPPVLSGLSRDQLVHGAKFNNILSRLNAGEVNSVAIVGGSQSAIEIMIYLADKFPHVAVHGVSRKFGYRLKDTSPFTGEVYFPGFVDLFYSSKPEHKQRLKDDLNLTNYSASDADVLDELYRTLYRDKHFGNNKLKVHNSVEIVSAVTVGSKVSLELIAAHSDENITSLEVDMVISATGFRDFGPLAHQELCPALLDSVYPLLEKDEVGEMRVGRDYRLALEGLDGLGLYLNGLCESSHGMGDAGSLSLVSIRSKNILDSIKQLSTANATSANLMKTEA